MAFFGYQSDLTFNGNVVARVVSMNWRIVNPYSILHDFDKWFDHECGAHGLTDSTPTFGYGLTTA